MATEVQSLQYRIGMQASGFLRGVQAVGGGLRRISTRVQTTQRTFNDAAGRMREGLDSVRAASVAAAAGLVGISLGVYEVLTTASDAQEQLSKFGEVFGETTQKNLKFARETAKAMQRSRAQIRGFLADSRAITGPLLDNAQAADKMARGITELAVDLASFHNKADTESFQALISGIVGETEPMRRFGVLLTETALEQFRLERGISKSVQTMTEAEKVQLRWMKIMEDTTAAQGDAIRTADEFANMVRGFRGGVVNLAESFGNRLLPAGKQVIRWMREGVQWLGDLSDEQKDQIVQWGLWTAAILAGVAALGLLAPIISAVIGAMQLLVVALAVLASPTTWRLGGLIAVAVALWTAWDKDWGGLKTRISDWADVVKEKFQQVRDIAKQLADVWTDEDLTLGEKLKATVGIVLTPIKDWIDGFVDKIKDQWTDEQGNIDWKGVFDSAIDLALAVGTLGLYGLTAPILAKALRGLFGWIPGVSLVAGLLSLTGRFAKWALKLPISLVTFAGLTLGKLVSGLIGAAGMGGILFRGFGKAALKVSLPIALTLAVINVEWEGIGKRLRDAWDRVKNSESLGDFAANVFLFPSWVTGSTPMQPGLSGSEQFDKMLNNALPFQDGTILPGFGGGDRIPALLEAGEAIIPAKVVRGGLMAIVEWLRKMGVPRFQDGGWLSPTGEINWLRPNETHIGAAARMAGVGPVAREFDVEHLADDLLKKGWARFRFGGTLDLGGPFGGRNIEPDNVFQFSDKLTQAQKRQMMSLVKDFPGDWKFDVSPPKVLSSPIKSFAFDAFERVGAIARKLANSGLIKSVAAGWNIFGLFGDWLAYNRNPDRYMRTRSLAPGGATLQEILEGALFKQTTYLQRGAILPGVSGPDQHPAILAPGEAVVPSKVVRGGWLAVLEWFRTMGAPGFAQGTVGFSSGGSSTPSGQLGILQGAVKDITDTVLSGLGGAAQAAREGLLGLARQVLGDERYEQFAAVIDKVTGGIQTLYDLIGKTNDELEGSGAPSDRHAMQALFSQRVQKAESLEWQSLGKDIAAGAKNLLGRAIAPVVNGLRSVGAVLAQGAARYVKAFKLRRFSGIVVQFIRDLGSAGKAAIDFASGLVGGIGQMIVDASPILSDVTQSVTSVAAAGPQAMAIAGITAVLSHSKQFGKLMEAINPLLQAVADTLGAFLGPLIPVAQLLAQKLEPILQKLAPVFAILGQILAEILMPVINALAWVLEHIVLPVLKFVAETIAGAWNALAEAINWALGWLGVHVDKIDVDFERDDSIDTGGGDDNAGTGPAFAELAGPTRDLLVELLRPLASLNTWTGYFEQLVSILTDIRGHTAAMAGINGMQAGPQVMTTHTTGTAQTGPVNLTIDAKRAMDDGAYLEWIAEQLSLIFGRDINIETRTRGR